MSKLILGTASFGIPDYGIKHDGQPSIKEIEKIAQVAWDGGIRDVHYSFQYGWNHADIFDDFTLIVKDVDNPRYFKWNGMKGLSVYNPELIKEPLDMVQYPVNVLDRRCIRFYPGMINIARSVFLQGLLLLPILNIPSWIDDHEEACNRIMDFHFTCKKEGLEWYEAALGWVLGLDEVDYVIVGVNSAKQLEELLAVKPLKWDYDFSIQDEMVLDPRRWPKA